MTYFSVGVLYSAQEFLRFVQTEALTDLSFPEIFQTFGVASPNAILEVSQQAGWIRVDTSGKLRLTNSGLQIASILDATVALSTQLGSLIETTMPPWLPLLSRGREEAAKYLPPDVMQCLSEAGLFESPTDQIVQWWDTYSKVSRRATNDLRIETGRIGEKLSIKYEISRTNRQPEWRGFESNLLGYDILSIIDKDDHSRLRIEVKTSRSTFKDASFHLSVNEWTVATTSPPFIFHLWTLCPSPILAIIYPDDVSPHVPNNNGLGCWESVDIQFSPFVSKIVNGAFPG
jgi:hypothetical protein